ncbi:MAG: hypothetical protein K2X99_04750 [Gemmatimonadaceae bacterium]|nr:hypothetical protein [Gemmatimonadaceae bacterium]
MHSVRTLITAALLPAALLAQDLPKGADLVAKHNAAAGGRAAWEKHSSIHLVGTFGIAAMGLEGAMHVYRAKPALSYTDMQLGAMGSVQNGFDGTTAWAIDPQRGALLLEGKDRDAAALAADFFSDVKDASKFKSIETQAVVDFEGRKVYKVLLTRPDSIQATVYFDVETGLEAGMTVESDTPMGKTSVTSILSDYKDFGGIKIATKRVQRLPQFDVVNTFTAVEFDAVPATVFALPDAINALIKK